MVNASYSSEGFIVLPEIVCKAIPERAAAPAPEIRFPDLRSLTNEQLIELVQSRNGAAAGLDLPTIKSIAEERLAASEEDARLADQLLQTCRDHGNGLE